MRKFVLPLLVAGALAFTATSAMATANIEMGAFTEEHVQGDHYKVTDVMEAGAHGTGIGGYQLDSAILKSLAAFAFEGDDSYGYTTGANPFVPGLALGEDTEDPLAAPAYTLPCPEWVSGGSKGTCPAQTNPIDPQTEMAEAIWDGVVLDDLYQAVGDDDSTFATFAESSTETWSVKNVRFLDQTLDILFYGGKRGTVSLGTTVIPLTMRNYDIDQTLDQDLADYLHEYEGTTTVDPLHETMGIFGKLTQLFQLAGAELTVGQVQSLLGATTVVGQPEMMGGYGAEGCASYGSMDPTEGCYAVIGGEVMDGFGFSEALADAGIGDLNAHFMDQWLVAEMYDWHPYNGTDADLQGKYRGRGVIQEYSSWFRDGSPADYNFSYDYPGGHGTINKTVSGGLDHGGIDP